MAQAPKAAEGAEGAEGAAPKSKKKLIIIIAAVAILAGGGGAAWFFMQPKPEAKEAHKKEEKKHEAEAPPVFVSMETFTVNLQPDPDEKFLQVDMTLKIEKAEQEEEVKAHMPELRNRILMLLTSKKPSDVTTLEGKNQLSKEILEQVKQPFTHEGEPLPILGVFFTSFVVQ